MKYKIKSDAGMWIIEHLIRMLRLIFGNTKWWYEDNDTAIIMFGSKSYREECIRETRNPQM